MKSTVTKKGLSLLLALAICLSLCVLPAAAEQAPTAAAGSLKNTSGDGGEAYISLTDARSFKVSIPVNMTEAQAKEAAKTAVWSLTPDTSKPYLDETLFPNQTKGGALTGWVCADGETPLFSKLVSDAETANGTVCLTLTFDSVCYFGDDQSVPHKNGGDYMDVCGYFLLQAAVDGKTLGGAEAKVTPYDGFHTMAEIYSEIDDMVAYAKKNTDLYVEKFSMGQSQGDNGLAALDMPYLIVAKNSAAVKNWQAIKAQAESDPDALIAKIENGTLGSYQVPVMYSNVHANEVAASDGVMDFSWMLLESAAGSGKLDYQNLTGFTEAGKAELAAELGEAGKAGSVAVPDLVADTATYLGYLHGDNIQENEWGANFYSGEIDMDSYYTSETVTVKVDDLLDDVFFILVPEENVEGRTYLTRTSSGGFDLNRDNSFQTQAETQNMAQLIAAWNPVSYTEFHGRIEAFQCEPCDPPHEPNFEYDLLAEHLMSGGEALGIAAVANNDGHNSYVIPQRDYLSYTGEKNADGSDQTQWYDPWDDMSTSYTPQYAMLHGTASYTVEVPAYNQDVVTALAYGQLGQSNYIAANKDSYLLSQTKILSRGVNNANSDAYDQVGQWFCDQYDVEGAESALFRPEYNGAGENGNFYPECYIIPMDSALQSNLQDACDMMEYLTRNGVKVMLTKSAFTYEGVSYPAGTMIVSMYQAKRSVANGVLYSGTVITEWPVLYSEGITAFNMVRGFDMVTCAKPAAYQTIKAACGSEMDAAACQSYLKGVTSAFTGVTGGKVIISNASEDSTAAVNTLLKTGNKVGMILSGDQAGSFICDYSAWLTVCGEYLLTGTGVLDQLPLSLTIEKAPVIYITGAPADSKTGFVKTKLVSGAYEYNYDRQALEMLGFTTTTDAGKADLIVGASAPDAAALAAIQNGTPYIGYGRRIYSAIGDLFAEGALKRQTAGDSAMDALAYVTYPTQSMVTASYVTEEDNILYGYGAGYFSAIPTGAQALIKLDSSKGLIEGFLPSDGEHYADFLKDSVQAISYQGKGKNGEALDLVLFANTLTNKVNQRDEFNFISNTAFSKLLGQTYTGSVQTAADAKALANVTFTDVTYEQWYAQSAGEAYAAGLMNGTDDGVFAAEQTTSRSMLVTTLYRLAGKPEAENAAFTDVKADAWYAASVSWAVQAGVTNGATATTFAPDSSLTREQAVAMLYRYAAKQGLDTGAKADLSGYSDGTKISAYAKDAMAWAVKVGLVQGYDNALNPAATATRAEFAALLTRAAALLSAKNA